MPRTMTAEREVWFRKNYFDAELLAELDAERAAHQETQAQRDSAERLLVSAVELDRKTKEKLGEAQAISRELLEALEDAAQLLSIVPMSFPYNDRSRDVREKARPVIAKARRVLPAALPDQTGDQQG